MTQNEQIINKMKTFLTANMNLDNLDLDTLKEAAIKINEDTTIQMEVWDAVMDTLQEAMSEDDFVEFCDTKLL
jgi:hypothetical protein